MILEDVEFYSRIEKIAKRLDKAMLIIENLESRLRIVEGVVMREDEEAAIGIIREDES